MLTRNEVMVPKPGNQLYIGEIFDYLNQLGSDDDKIWYLRLNDTPTLRIILNLLFDTRLEWYGKYFDVPNFFESDAPIGLNDSNLFLDTRKLYLFRNPEMAKNGANKTKTLLIQMLESLHPLEVKVVKAIIFAKERVVQFGVTKDIVNRAFPGLLL